MKLTDYIKAIESCPDELVKHNYENREFEAHRLQYDYGVYDNFNILTKGNFEEMGEHMKKMGYSFMAEGIDTRNGYKEFKSEDKLGIVLRNNLWIINDHRKELSEEIKKQKENFNLTISLHHDNHEDKNWGIPFLGDLRKEIKNIGKYFVKNKIPFSFTKTYGLKEPIDPSKIVYYFPKENKKGGQTQ